MWFRLANRVRQASLPFACSICGSEAFLHQDGLWPELIAEWGLSEFETRYINTQQCTRCSNCGSNVRSMGLAAAIVHFYCSELLLSEFCNSSEFQNLRVLEINEAGMLTSTLKKLTGHQLATYPEIDMQNMPYDDKEFDLVIHSDTLEHVPNPVLGLSECRRILKPKGACIFTIPMVHSRLTRRREGLPVSNHGSRTGKDRYPVMSEYGADAWKDVIDAGFDECRMFNFLYPECIPLIAQRWR